MIGESYQTLKFDSKRFVGWNCLEIKLVYTYINLPYNKAYILIYF